LKSTNLLVLTFSTILAGTGGRVGEIVKGRNVAEAGIQCRPDRSELLLDPQAWYLKGQRMVPCVPGGPRLSPKG
jgi:hypothetical protein